MKNTMNRKKIQLWLYLCLICSISFAQSKQGAVKGTRTDKNFANTTEIHKTEKATDDQVLAEIEGDYGLGDIIHISNAPPVATFLPSHILPSVIESSKTTSFPVILPATYFKMPKKVAETAESHKRTTNKSKNPTSVSVAENKEKENKKKDFTEKQESNLTDSPVEKKGKLENTINPSEKQETSSSKKMVIDEQKNKLTAIEKKNTVNIISTNADKKWMSDNMATYTPSSRRTHRSTSTRLDNKKPWFPFFNKKKTSSMPRTVKNKKKDRCDQF